MFPIIHSGRDKGGQKGTGSEAKRKVGSPGIRRASLLLVISSPTPPNPGWDDCESLGVDTVTAAARRRAAARRAIQARLRRAPVRPGLCETPPHVSSLLTITVRREHRCQLLPSKEVMLREVRSLVHSCTAWQAAPSPPVGNSDLTDVLRRPGPGPGRCRAASTGDGDME